MNILCLPRLFIAWSTCLLAMLFVGFVYAASAEKKPPAPEPRETLEVNTEEMLKPWQGISPACSTGGPSGF